jgi:hypothetical protein
MVPVKEKFAADAETIAAKHTVHERKKRSVIGGMKIG